MTTLHIGNVKTEEMSGDPALLTDAQLRLAGCAAERALWFARDGDVVVLPAAPQDAFVEHVTRTTGVHAPSLRIVVPPAGHAGDAVLTADRLADERLRTALRAALDGRPLTRVRAYYPDASVVALAEALGAPRAVPGHAFLAQGGAAAANSKALFRAVAAGLGIPLAPGTTAARPRQAEDAVVRWLDAGHPVILKRDLQSAGEGNEILSPDGVVRPLGADRVVVLNGRPAVRAHLAERWPWLTDGGRGRLVVERYLPGVRPVYAEYLVTDGGIEPTGEGELLMAPLLDGIAIPVPGLAPGARAALLRLTRRLCEAYRAIGYRGTMSVDGLVTPDGAVLLNETNSRLSGATHLHDVVGRLAGPGRALLDRAGWAVPSFGEALRRLADTGHAFDPSTRTGTLLTCDFTRLNGTVGYCVAADGIGAARQREARIRELFTPADRR
ncbi:peptide ligase PGM1-related protein [Actinomadura kijaniata]|uniref:preATP grasp domain-containing protein n=1 Tax=Actinomadura kijaniata TaxID=46161 RepID=UPI000834B4B2|nr:peptide ligase PGM1-related protein [Actinomadura kijaniata]